MHIFFKMAPHILKYHEIFSLYCLILIIKNLIVNISLDIVEYVSQHLSWAAFYIFLQQIFCFQYSFA